MRRRSKQKRDDLAGYFILACLISPIICFLLLAILGKVKEEGPSPETHIRCPDCAEYQGGKSMQTLWLQTGAPMKTRIALFITAFLATACSSIEMIDGAATAPLADTCNVSIYQTRRQAEKLGQIEEVCIVIGTSSGSFSHTVQTAIAKHKSKICQCRDEQSLYRIEERKRT